MEIPVLDLLLRRCFLIYPTKFIMTVSVRRSRSWCVFSVVWTQLLADVQSIYSGSGSVFPELQLCTIWFLLRSADLLVVWHLCLVFQRFSEILRMQKQIWTDVKIRFSHFSERTAHIYCNMEVSRKYPLAVFTTKTCFNCCTSSSPTDT